MSITVVMITCDRVARGKSRNYLADTISNADRAGIFRSQYLHAFSLFPTEWSANWPPDTIELKHADFYAHGRVCVWPNREMLACENAGRALEWGGKRTNEKGVVPWVLFMEDDLDFCASFLESVHDWLADNATESERVYSFGCAYSQLMEQAYSCLICGKASQDITHCVPTNSLQAFVRHPFMQRSYKLAYPGPNTFYGTQCFAVRSSDAISLGQYLYSNPTFPDGLQHPNSYDLMISQWVEQRAICDLEDLNGRPIPESMVELIAKPTAAKAIVASVPSFVQHIGQESVCTDIEPGKVHTFSTWPGREWSYNAR